MSDYGYSTAKTAFIAIPIAVVVAIAITVLSITIYHASLAGTAADTKLGSECITAGSSWVKGTSGYQCIAGGK